MLYGEGSQMMIGESKGSLSVLVALIKWVPAIQVKNVRMVCLIFAESSSFLWTVLGLDFWLLDHTIRFLRPGCAHIPLPQIEALMDLGVSSAEVHMILTSLLRISSLVPMVVYIHQFALYVIASIPLYHDPNLRQQNVSSRWLSGSIVA